MDIHTYGHIRAYELLAKNATKALNDFSENQLENEKSEGSAKINQSEFVKDVYNVIRDADILIEVLDARDPNSSRCIKIENFIISEGKHLILLLNKIDLVPNDIVQSWVTYLKKYYPTITFKSMTSKSSRKPVHNKTHFLSVSDESCKTSHQVLGVTELMSLIKNYTKKNQSQNDTSVTVGIIGIPNVGKSSIINSLSRNIKGVRVGGEAGITRHSQEISLTSKIKLIDTPGIIVDADTEKNKNELILLSSVKLTQIDNLNAPIELILSKYSKDKIMSMFNVPFFKDTDDFLNHIARKKGKLKKGGCLDLEAAALSVLCDWGSGKIEHYELHPIDHEINENTDIELLPRIVTELQKPFQIN